MFRALWHWLAARYYLAALSHVGLAHPDSAFIAIQHAIHADRLNRWLNGE